MALAYDKSYNLRTYQKIYNQAEKVFKENKFSRIPVYENNIDNIIGLIHEKDFYDGIFSIAMPNGLQVNLI